MSRNKAILLLSFLAVVLVPTTKVLASPACPVCTAAVLGGIGLSRWLGIDDTITGLWIGALLIVFTYWTIKWLNIKKITFPGIGVLICLLYYISVLIPLYLKDIIGHPKNVLWGIDKFILGILIGGILFFIGVIVSDILKEKNNNKVYFPFQKVVLPIAPVLIMSLVFYLLVKF